MGNLLFEGLRVVDFGWVWAGTVLGHVLADYGAEVIKIESKRRLDGLRFGKVFELGEELEKNPFFHNLNRNKLSITVDFTKPEGEALIKALVKKSDIVVENFTPGILQKYGLDYKSLNKVKSDIIMISLSATGQSGPLSQIVIYAPILSALSGIDSMVGYPDDRPLGLKHAYADPTASLFGLFAVLSALRYRDRAGKGQYIDLSQCESIVGLIGEAILDYEMNGRIAGPVGNQSSIMGPHGIYPCKGEDKWVSIAIKTEGEWEAFCRVIGNPLWCKENDKFGDVYKRVSNAKELDKCIARWTLNYTDYEVAEILQNGGVAATPVLSTDGIFLDPHFNERKVFVDVEHPLVRNTVVYNLPWKFNSLDPKPMRHAPLLGEHNEYVFKDILGLSTDEIDELVKGKVIN